MIVVPEEPEIEEPPQEIPILPSSPPSKQSLEEAMREALEALEAPPRRPAPRPPGGVSPPTANSAAIPTEKPATTPTAETATAPAKPAAAPSVQARPKPPGARPVPDKQALEEALKATLEAFDAGPQTPTAPTRRVPQRGAVVRDSVSVVVAPARRRGRTIAILAGVAVGVIALGAGAWLARRPRPPIARADAPVARQAPRLRAPEGDRAGVTQAVTALRDLQAMSKPDVQFRMYFNRVAFVKADVERSLQTAKDSDVKTSLRDVMALHTLAAAAWRAKTLNEPAKWEALADEPAIELCPAVKRMVLVDDPPPNMTRPQWRGIALASGVPVLWDCASERLTDVERALK